MFLQHTGLDIVADKALIGFLKVLVGVNRDIQIIAYRDDKRLVGDNDKFNLRMGFGLHAGWAIEGAVGSLQKVDATYLSPHVNMAARMEAASKQFGVEILMSERFFEVRSRSVAPCHLMLLNFHRQQYSIFLCLCFYYTVQYSYTACFLYLITKKLMSPEAQDQCRKLDVVTVKGSAVPMPIYTYDVFQKQVFPQLRTPKFSNLNLEEVLNKQADEYDSMLWTQDPDLIQLRCLSTPVFKRTYRQGLDHYLNGNWDLARDFLSKADQMMANGDAGGDGPSRTLLDYMQARNWKCPSDWDGYRPLTSK